ncbi:DUF1850 domain-containing protein [Nocardiopsis lucentensis]|uniref:DUF1850 domain-containing protein n=1 Tax=Nocardiopsis lucentensis TaxID=53441 RepID=UPI000A30D6B7|nr:DUF1850 domain-containing protein [Nocardiopsis lucentensis]
MTASHRAARWIPGGPALVTVLLGCALALTGSTDTGTAWFAVRVYGREEPVLSVPVEVGDRIELSHTHSVHRRPVHEVYSVSPSAGLAMEELRADAHGANLPSGPETVDGVTSTFVREDGGYRVEHHGRPLGTVRMVVGTPDVDHRLTLGGREIRLLDLVAPRARVELFVQTHPGVRAM